MADDETMPTLEERMLATAESFAGDETDAVDASTSDADENDTDDAVDDVDETSADEAATDESAVSDDQGDESPYAEDGEDDATDESADATDAEQADASAASVSDLDPAFVEAVRKQGITADLSDLPDALRPILLEKVKHMNAGYTRAMQEVRSFRKEKAELDAVKTYQTQHPDQYLADLISADPKLIETVNAELERRQDPTYAKALEKSRDADAKLATVQAAEAEVAAQSRQEQIEALEVHCERAIKAAGIPTDLVADAITLLTQQAHAAGRLPTEAELDAVIQRHAQTFKRHMGAQKGATKRQFTRDYLHTKRQDKATAGMPGKPSGSAASTARPPQKAAASLEEAMYATLDRIGVPA